MSRTVIAHGVEFEVKWDGAHHNTNDDLLFAGIKRLKVSDVDDVDDSYQAPRAPDHIPQLLIPTAVMKVAAAIAEAPLTQTQIMAQTGLQFHPVKLSLLKLRRQGRLRTRTWPGPQAKGRGRRVQEYWLVAL